MAKYGGNQPPLGPARSSRKLIFIKPILVNARHFDGDVADTEYWLRTMTRA